MLRPKPYRIGMTAENLEVLLASIPSKIDRTIIRTTLANADDTTIPTTKAVQDALDVISGDFSSLGNLAFTDDIDLSSNQTKGVTPISKGGTGANSLENAQSNLGIVTETEIEQMINDAIPVIQEVDLGSNQATGTLPLGKGGTGANTAQAARDNLSVYSRSREDTWFKAFTGATNFDFATGGILTDKKLFVYHAASDKIYKYVGSLDAPITVVAGTNPVGNSDWIGFDANSAAMMSNSKGGSVQDFIDAQFTTVAELATGKFHVGQYVKLKDRAMGLFLLKSGGTPTGGRVLDAGNGNTAELQITHQTFIEHWGAKGDWNTTLKTGTDNYPVLAEIKAYAATLPSNAGWVGGLMEAEGLRVSSGRGTFGVSQTVDWNSVSVTLDFAGTMQTIFEAMPSFASNTPIFRLGSKTTKSITKSSKLQNCSFNCGAITGVRGFEFYGLRDSSRIADILVTGFTGTAVYSDFAGQAGGAWMTQGLKMDNVHAISFVHQGGVIYDLGGVFETEISAGKALLNSASTSITADIIGYRIGRTECRGVTILCCASGNFFGTGYNAGIVYENAVECKDIGCTFEGINGPNVEFGKTQPCAVNYSDLGRHYNPNPTAAPNNKQYIFRNANACGARTINASASSEAVSFETGSVNCGIDIKEINGTVSQAKANVIKFNGGSGNHASGYATSDGAFFTLSGNNTSAEGFSNGARESHDAFWSNFFLAAGGYRYRRSSDNAEMLTVINTALASLGTSLKVRIHDGTSEVQRDIKVGAANSGPGGVGRALYTNN